jgi:hypothetical protein
VKSIVFFSLTPSLLLILGVASAEAASCQSGLSSINPDSAYIDHGNGTVSDLRTGLMWKKCVEGLSGTSCQTGAWVESFTWSQALARAEESTFAGYSDWRLPSVKELSSLVEHCRILPVINTNYFPNATPGHPGFWSGSPSSRYTSNSWVVRFDVGSTHTEDRRLSYGGGVLVHARFVRDGR